MAKNQDVNLQTLEFPKIKQQLAELTLSEAGRKKAMNIKPSSDLAMISKWQEETTDGLTLLNRKNGLPLAAFKNIRPHLKRLEIGASLNGLEIRDIRRVLSISNDLISFFKNVREDPDIELLTLDEMSQNLIPLVEITREIDATIDQAGEILDSASPTLKNIRTQINQAQQSIRNNLNRFVSGSGSRYLSDTIITMRNDRYVIPVKSESRGNVPGVVHDQSSSGQTLFIEPQNVVNLNNQIASLQAAEKSEVERILVDLSLEIAGYTNDIMNDFNLLTLFDFIQAKAQLSRNMKATRPEISEDNKVALYNSRHPLINPDDVVANDLIIGEDYRIIIVTGPNTGGKTVVLKTLGLLQLMGQAGLHLPADKGSTMGIFDKIYADIGDEQSIEQNLSTFSSHMTNIIDILEKMTPKSLVLFDELGAGTDPQEGAALAISILEMIENRGTTTVITSHYPELKAYGYNKVEVTNASMTFDIDTFSPTYQLRIGIPGRSNAFEIATRLGMPDNIIERSRDLMSGESQSVDSMIADLETQRRNAQAEFEFYEENMRETTKLRRQLEQAYNDLVQDREKLLEEAEEKADKKIQRRQEQAEKIIQDLRNRQLQMGTSGNVKEHELIDAQSQMDHLRTKEEKDLLATNKHVKKAEESKELKVGDEVDVPMLGQHGTLVEELNNKEWMVQLGSMKMKMDEDKLVLQNSNQENTKKPKRKVTASVKPRVTTELDLRGVRYEEAMDKLSKYIDAALLNNYETVTIIHGHGTGALREGVQSLLKRHSQVETFNYATANQGGTGATIVNFKS